MAMDRGSRGERMIELEDQINQFEEKLKIDEMQINDIAMSAGNLSPYDYDMFCIVQYGPKPK